MYTINKTNDGVIIKDIGSKGKNFYFNYLRTLVDSALYRAWQHG